MSYQKYKGLIAATMTPMNADGSLNLSLLPDYCRHLTGAGVTQIFLNGSAAEHASLTTTERKALAEKWTQLKADEDNGLQKVIVQCGAGSLADSVELAKHAAGLSVDAIAAVAPTYYKCDSMQSLVECMRQVAAAAPNKPFIYYHIPMVTGLNYRLSDFFRAAHGKIPTLCGAKFTNPDLYDATEAMRLFDRKYDVIIGAETMLLGALSMGIQSAIGVSFSCLGPPCNRIYEAYEKGDIKLAQEEQYKVQDFWSAMPKATASLNGMMASFKFVLSKSMGADFGPTRLPMLPLTGAETQAIENYLTQIKYQEWMKK